MTSLTKMRLAMARLVPMPKSTKSAIPLHLGACLLALLFVFSLTSQIFETPAMAQETTGGLQGAVTDPSGAVVPKAKVTVTAPTLVGSKVVLTDAAGYYRFANLPPGNYTITVEAEGFETLKREGLGLEVGHLPTVNLSLKVGTVNTVVQVNTEGPMIDTTTVTTLTNIPEETLSEIPHGTSFQSVIQFAPAARNEPLEGSNMLSNGSGSVSPGNGSNGGQFGFSIGGGADSENSYLVEGQETANIIGGYSHTNVPMDFIQEVQMKTSGVEAEYGGALGGVVNVIMQKGTQKWHGSVFASFQKGAWNGSENPYQRYDPTSSGTVASWGQVDPNNQEYQPVRPKTSDFFPGATLGGPLFGFLRGHENLKNRIFMFVGFNPEFNAYERTLNYGNSSAGGLGLGNVPFSQNTHTFYSVARIDAEATQKIRVFGSWLYQGQKQYGESLPGADSAQGLYNGVTDCSGKGANLTCGSNGISPSTYKHDIGYSAPNMTLNTGADITINNSLVATSRFGYYFENYHDFGYPTTGTIYDFASSGTGGTDTNGNALPSTLQQSAGNISQAIDGSFTHLNANKAIQFDQDVAWFHAGKGGTHNFKFGYQLNRNSNYIFQGYNAPLVYIYPGTSVAYKAQGAVGSQNCSAVEAITGYSSCVGTYGNVNVNDFGSGGRATAYNHGFYAQDAWTIGHGITINAGIRLEHEYLPAENQPNTAKLPTPINFGWGAKVAPRIGAAWDVFKNGKLKVFGMYGQFYDQMKLNVAISSYGGQYWQECWYALMEPGYSNITPVLNSSNRYCVGQGSTSQANFGSSNPSGITFLENINNRAFPTTCSTCSSTEEGTAPGLKPYAQHDSAFGVDYQLSPNWAFEARWDRRRLDHVIEDSAIYNPNAGETFVIVNPGEGVNSTFNGFWNFLYGSPIDCTYGCPSNQKIIPPARNYDGIEFRLTRQATSHWLGMFSYTYSNLRGNYTGLTSSDVADGGGGRNAPNNSRAFDEPYFSWNALGGSSSGLLPTDRPSAAKGYGAYVFPWMRRFNTTAGIFETAYSGTPLTSYADVGYAFPGAFPVDIVNRGKWVDVSQDPTSGAINFSQPYTKRTPAYLQTDFNFKQEMKVGEGKSVAFDATFNNMFNQRSVTSSGQQVDSNYSVNFITPESAGCAAFNATPASGIGAPNVPQCYVVDGPAFYAAALSKYDYAGLMRNSPLGSTAGGPITINSEYNKPYLYQLSRNIRLAVHFTF